MDTRSSTQGLATDDPRRRPTNDAAFKCIVVLIAIVLLLAGTVGWLLQREPTVAQPTGVVFQSGIEGRNIVREGFPEVDFRPLYPGMSSEAIDRLQRETFAVRYVYSPFVQFRGLPMDTEFVQLTADGIRLPGRPQPFPPNPGDLSVFVFGGSTVFGNNLPPDQTLPAFIERELKVLYPSTNVVVYNFGCGYYYSSQERALFDRLLERGIVPDVAIFVDGLNDFLTPLGIPKFTREYFQFSAPDLGIPPEPVFEDDFQRRGAVRHLLKRYEQNVKLISATAEACGVTAIFVGQPVPYFAHTTDERIYPFRKERALDKLCEWGYPTFAQRAIQESFGPRFIWAGDVFTDANETMYSDSIHYSPAGARILAREIVTRAVARGLLSPAKRDS